MLQVLYRNLDQSVFRIEHEPEPVRRIENIAAYNEKEGLALNPEEIQYLEDLRPAWVENLPMVRYSVSPRSIQNIADIRFSMAFSSSTAKKSTRPFSSLSKKRP